MNTDSGQMRPIIASDLAEDEISLSSKASAILDKIPANERVQYLARSTEPELWEAKEALKKKYKINKSATSIKVGRNQPCPCGSGKKYKKCCGSSIDKNPIEAIVEAARIVQKGS